MASPAGDVVVRKVEQWRQDSIRLNRMCWRTRELLGEIPPGATSVAVDEDVEPLLDRLAAALTSGSSHGRAQDALTRLSQWIDEGNAHRDGEAVTWGRLSKLSEEVGEVIAAFIGATGQNPRKGVTHTVVDVGDELLDLAITALAAHEHLTLHTGDSLDRLVRKIYAVAKRAGVLDG